MEIGQKSQNLISLSSLLDASKQQKATEDKQVQDTRQGRIANRESERDQLIQQNRDAIQKIQDDIRLKSLTKLKENSETEDDRRQDLNLRENISNDNGQPEFKKKGQIVDIRI